MKQAVRMKINKKRYLFLEMLMKTQDSVSQKIRILHKIDKKNIF